MNEILKKKYYDFKGTTFFGSRNRGNFSSESDFDVAVLFPKEPNWEKENEILDIIYEMELKYDILIDGKVPWGHHALLMEKIKDQSIRIWYMEQISGQAKKVI